MFALLRYWVINIAIAVLIGAVASVLIYGFHHVMYAIMFGYSHLETTSLVNTASHLSPILRVMVPAIGAFVAGVIMWWYKVRNRCPTPHSTDYHVIKDEHHTKLDIIPSLIKCLAILAIVSTGNAIGKEGAMILLSALGASLVAYYLSSANQRHWWINCGTAAGMSCAYFTPLASCFYVMEIIIKARKFQLIPLLLISAFTATFLSHYFHHSYGHLYSMTTVNRPSLINSFLMVIIALLMGCVGPLFFKCIYYARQCFKVIPLPFPILFFIGGLLVGLLSLITPAVWGNGYSSVQMVLSTPALPFTLALTILIVKFIAMMAINGSGAPGGTFTPVLFVGAYLGFVILHALAPLAIFPVGDSTFLALMGMSALLSSAIKAPLTAGFTVMEMSGQYHLLPFLLICSLLSYFVALRVRRYITM